MGPITRRHAMAAVCAVCITGRAAAQGPRRGCFARCPLSPRGFRQISEILAGADLDQQTGNAEWDLMLEQAIAGLSEFFGVQPGVGIYDDADEPNALSYDIGDPERGGISLAQVIKAKNRRRRKTQRLGSGKACMTGNQNMVLIDDERAYKPKRCDRSLDLFNLPVAMRLGSRP